MKDYFQSNKMHTLPNRIYPRDWQSYRYYLRRWFRILEIKTFHSVAKCISHHWFCVSSLVESENHFDRYLEVENFVRIWLHLFSFVSNENHFSLEKKIFVYRDIHFDFVSVRFYFVLLDMMGWVCIENNGHDMDDNCHWNLLDDDSDQVWRIYLDGENNHIDGNVDRRAWSRNEEYSQRLYPVLIEHYRYWEWILLVVIVWIRISYRIDRELNLLMKDRVLEEHRWY